MSIVTGNVVCGQLMGMHYVDIPPGGVGRLTENVNRPCWIHMPVVSVFSPSEGVLSPYLYRVTVEGFTGTPYWKDAGSAERASKTEPYDASSEYGTEAEARDLLQLTKLPGPVLVGLGERLTLTLRNNESFPVRVVAGFSPDEALTLMGEDPPTTYQPNTGERDPELACLIQPNVISVGPPQRIPPHSGVRFSVQAPGICWTMGHPEVRVIGGAGAPTPCLLVLAVVYASIPQNLGCRGIPVAALRSRGPDSHLSARLLNVGQEIMVYIENTEDYPVDVHVLLDTDALTPMGQQVFTQAQQESRQRLADIFAIVTGDDSEPGDPETGTLDN